MIIDDRHCTGARSMNAELSFNAVIRADKIQTA
jgi:hypothetical protein